MEWSVWSALGFVASANSPSMQANTSSQHYNVSRLKYVGSTRRIVSSGHVTYPSASNEAGSHGASCMTESGRPVKDRQSSVLFPRLSSKVDGK